MLHKRLFNVLLVFFCFLFLITPLLLLEKGTVLLFINKNHSFFLDGVFKILSSIGNGFSIVFIGVLLLLFFKVKYAFQFIFSFLIQLFIVLMFKEVLLHGSFRPFKYFGSNEGAVILNLVEGVKIYNFGSFPSGHTATIFFITTFLALCINNSIITFLLILLSFFVGMSRIYLVQHFFIDVYFGSIFGVLSSVIAFMVINSYKIPWYNRFIFPNIFDVFARTERLTTPKFR